MMGLILGEILILVVVAVVVFLAAKYILGEAEVDPPIRKIVLLIIGLLFLVWLANIISGHQIFPPLLR